MGLASFLNRLKFDHINFKNNNTLKLGTKSKWAVTKDDECKLGKWIIKSESEGREYTRTSNWASLKQAHFSVHTGMQEIIDENSKSASDNNFLKTRGQSLDQAISQVFWSIQEVKRDYGKNKN